VAILGLRGARVAFFHNNLQYSRRLPPRADPYLLIRFDFITNAPRFQAAVPFIGADAFTPDLSPAFSLKAGLTLTQRHGLCCIRR
jgi:hypothetical protein